MKTIIMLFAAILAAGCTTKSGPQATTPEDEARVAAALSGRIAGPPQDCVDARDLNGNTSYIGGVILFTGRTNDVVWLNRPMGGCSLLNPGRALKFTGPLLCSSSVVTVVDPATGREVGSCGLGEFTPYRLAR